MSAGTTEREAGSATGLTLLAAWRRGFACLDVVAIGSLLTCLAFAPALFLYQANPALGLLAAATLGWPVFAAFTRTVVRAVLGQDPGWATLPRELRGWGRDLLSGCMVAVPACCAWVAIYLRTANAAPVAIALLGAGAGVAGTVIAFVVALVMAATDFGRHSWTIALGRSVALVPRLAMVAAGSVIVGAAMVKVAASWSASVLPLIPGIVALCLAGGVWSVLLPTPPGAHSRTHARGAQHHA